MKGQETKKIEVVVLDGFTYWQGGVKYIGGNRLSVPEKDYLVNRHRFQPVEIKTETETKGNPKNLKDKQVRAGKQDLLDKGVSE